MAPKQKPGKSKQDYQTPPEFLGAVQNLLNIEGFWYDLAASEANSVTDEHHCFTEKQDSLAQDWSLLHPPKSMRWHWLNPPFSNIKPWVQKCWVEAQKGTHIAMLVPASVGSKWWADWVHGRAQVLLLNGRITFVGCATVYPKDCALLLWTPTIHGGYSTWKWA